MSPRRNRGTFSAAALSTRARKFRLWMSSWFRWASARKIAWSGEIGKPFSIGDNKIAQEISWGVGDDAALGDPVLDLSLQLPGPFCTMMMADYGADVVKIDEPIPRVRNPFATEDPGTGPLDRYLNRGKKSVTLDLKSSEGREIFRKLAATADVVVEGFRPGVVKRLGVEYETLSAANPGLVYCSISGYGQTGPMRDAAGHDVNYTLLRRGPGPFRAPGGSSGAAPRPGGGRLRRVDDGALRDPDGAAFPAADGEGGVDRHLDDRRDGRVDGDPRIGFLGGGVPRSGAPCRWPGCSPATTPTGARTGDT